MTSWPLASVEKYRPVPSLSSIGLNSLPLVLTLPSAVCGDENGADVIERTPSKKSCPPVQPARVDCTTASRSSYVNVVRRSSAVVLRSARGDGAPQPVIASNLDSQTS